MTSPLRRTAIVVLVATTILIAGMAAAWALQDVRDGRVSRNVTLAGEPVGGFSLTELTGVVRRVAARYADVPVRVDAPGGGFSSTTRVLGVAVRVAPTVAATMELGRTGPVFDRIGSWAGSFFGVRRAPVKLSIDAPSVYRVVEARDPGPRRAPREPTIKEANGSLKVVKGMAGRGIDAADVIKALPEAAAGGVPIRVRVHRGSVAPRFSVREAAKLVAQGEALTARGVIVRAGNQQATVPAALTRSWLRSEPINSGLRLAVDEKAATAGLRELFPKPDPAPKDAGFMVVNDQVSIVPERPGAACCADAAGRLVADAVLKGGGGPVNVPLRQVAPARTVASISALGVKELVGTFTTKHAPGQPRVKNIHLMADLVRGQIIGPGETFSVNNFVGPRTVQKGFVVDKVIEDGKYAAAVGGGISQFATTFFNAAFFAGMDFAEYQSHSIYISRYPYGREATLSYPKPDLRIRNPSPYGVLIWTSYTDTTITVSLYSTRWVNVAQTNQTEQPVGPCKRVLTERTRTMVADGTARVDRVVALYRPAEGVNCS